MPKHNNPPRLVLRLFRLFCHPDYVEDIEGDLIEKYHINLQKYSKFRSSLLLLLEVLQLVRGSLLRPFEGTYRLNSYGLFKHSLKISFRSFYRHRLTFIINLVGLVGGLMTTLFIYLWVNHEVTTDKFHKNDKDLYRLVSDVSGNTTLLNTSPRFANELLEEIPEIELLVNSSWGSVSSFLSLEQETFSSQGEFGTVDFFKVFSYPLIKGHKNGVLRAPNSIVLSESMALKLLNTLDVVGSQLIWKWYGFEEKVIVSGIFRDIPATSSSRFDYVLSFDVFEKYFGERIDRGNRNGRTFIQLNSEADHELVNKKISEYSKLRYPESDMRAPFLISYSDYYLNNLYENGQTVGGRITLVRLFGSIAIVVLLIACINFMNLTTARASSRVKEIGVKKAFGANRRSMIFQFMMESCLLSLFAGLIALLGIWLLFPWFQTLTDQNIVLQFDLQMSLSYIAIVLTAGILSGSYPALHLSRFRPLIVLKGKLNEGPKLSWMRKCLVVFQLCVSLVLIVVVVVIHQQMEYIHHRDLGYSSQEILNFETVGMTGLKQQSFLNEVRRLPGVEKAAGISHALFGAQKSGANITWEGKDPDHQVWFEWGYVDFDMLELLKVKLLEGRSFSREFGRDDSKVVINETTAKLMHHENPIGQKLAVGEIEYEIIGVIKDFNFESLHEQVKPTFFLLNNNWSMKIAIRLDEERNQDTMDQIAALYEQINPGFAFKYSFHDDDRADSYKTEEKTISLAGYAAVLAITISCLGIFGLISFVTERKSKEIGIRKILGASAGTLSWFLYKDFRMPITASGIIGTLIAFYLCEKWLAKFVYHIQLEWSFFLAPFIIMILLTVLTLGARVFKAVKDDPVIALRDE